MVHQPGPRCAVYGAGPAGLGLAVELAERGAQVRVVAPEPRAPWPASYGAFAEMLPQKYHAASLRHYRIAHIVRSDGQRIALHAPYLRLGTALLQELLTERAERLGVSFEHGRFEREQLDASEVSFDATGAQVRDRSSSPRYQSAYGMWAQVKGMDLSSDEMILLDFSGPEQVDPPSFLYALEERPGRVFLQETVLASAQPFSFAQLKERLSSRLDAAGLMIESELGEERCLIPMGAGLIERGTGTVVCFGARAGMTQPASGYQLARSLRLATRVAHAVTAPNTATAIERAASGRAAVWTRGERLLWTILDRGASVLTKMNQSELATFMSGFASQDPARFVRFIDGSSPLSEVARAMAQTYRACPPEIRRRLWGVLQSS